MVGASRAGDLLQKHGQGEFDGERMASGRGSGGLMISERLEDGKGVVGRAPGA